MRIERDLYQTIDPKGVAPLLPHLQEGIRYVEPCAGAGALIKQLRPHATCVQAMDIHPLAEGIEVGDMFTAQLGDADAFITNPPWTRQILHDLIVYLSDQGPTWLLFDSNWANTKQARPFMERCRRIVAVGRLIWMPGTKMAGKDDASWYEFGQPRAGSAPLFFGRGCLPPEHPKRNSRVCFDCGVMIDRFGKWRLQRRNGTLTPVHLHCDNPSSRFPRGQEPLAPLPLFEGLGPRFTMQPGADVAEDDVVIPFLRRSAE